MRKRFLLPALGLALGLVAFGSVKGPRILKKSALPDLRDGDIVFQESGGAQGEAVRLATNSPWTHVGIVFKEKDRWMVYEAVGPVLATPLDEWIEHGDAHHWVAKRWREAQTKLDANSTARLRHSADRFMGLPYDLEFRWNDEKIYCSELVWKMYKEALGVELCTPKAMREHDLGSPAVQRIMIQRYGSAPPLDEPMIAPGTLFECPLLTTVVER